MLRNDNKWIAELTGAAIAAAFALVQFVILQSSCFPKVPVKAQLAEIEPAVLAMNALILFCVILVLRLLAGKWSTALLISSVVMTIWAIANHYTALFHGGGLFPSELRSAGTASTTIGRVIARSSCTWPALTPSWRGSPWKARKNRRNM